MSAAPRPAARRRSRWLAAVPPLVVLVELAGILLVGEALGAGWTLLLLLAGAVVGGLALVRGGLGGVRRVAARARDGRTDGRAAGRELADAGLVALGALLLLLPGFVSDLAGLLCLFPPTRPLVRRLLGAAAGTAALRVVGLRRGDVVAGRVVVEPDRPDGRSGPGGPIEGRVLPPRDDPRP
ncbi:FxsA family protein [uncultured Pseudokineococcus sp.]|uniref:FxsA family protein n=1 Tax=uncultured Pseudokineococcus sp. TaxID=1642928 RepID=UPI00262AA0A9|nr:FxsA family protein [uncultured Pseudokineococcus sp.]